MAEARKLAGNVSEESEVTPRRSFSRNIFLHDGDRVKGFVPSCGDKSEEYLFHLFDLLSSYGPLLSYKHRDEEMI